MLTPGIAGGIATTISFPLAYSFDLKLKWITIIISFILALFIELQSKEKIKLMKNSLCCILNTLIIFSVSIGGSALSDPPPKLVEADIDAIKILKHLQSTEPSSDNLFFLNIKSAYAQEEKETTKEGNHITPPPERIDQHELTEEDIKILKNFLQKQEEQIKKEEDYRRRWSW
jgi:hypothetical protein